MSDLQDIQHYNWRDQFHPTEYEFIDLIKSEPIHKVQEGIMPAAIDPKDHRQNVRAAKIRRLAKQGIGGEKKSAEKKTTGPKLFGEEKKDHEYSMARSEISTLQNAAKRLKKKMGKKGEGNLEAWVQSKITKAADYIDTAADYVTNESVHASKTQIHSPHEVPTKNLKKLVSKAVKRIDTDVDGDTDRNDKAKGELGEFIPGVNNKRLYSTTRTKTAKESFSNWREELGEE